MSSIKTFMFVAAAILGLSTGTPLAAQEELPLEAGKVWTHRHSGIDMPARIGDLSRTRGTVFESDELDLGISFANSGTRDFATIYIYRNTGGAVPVWFAQSQYPIEHSTNAGTPALAIAPRAFIPPRQSRETGLQAVYALTGGTFASTGVTIFPVGGWYVKIRATAGTRSPEQNIAWMNELLAALRLPPGSGEPVAAPIARCTTPLTTAGDGDNPIRHGVEIERPAARIAADRWCRDAMLGGNRAVYRPSGTNDRYLIAIGDNGNAVSAIREKGRDSDRYHYSLNFVTASVTFALPAHEKLPSPQTALALVAADKVNAQFDTWPPR